MQEIFNLTPAETWFGKPQEINKKISEWKINWTSLTSTPNGVKVNIYNLKISEFSLHFSTNLDGGFSFKRCKMIF